MSTLSCGESSNSNDLAGGGIGGTGIPVASVGPIAERGSITVNGVIFETDTAQILFDGTAVSDDSPLKVGMVVRVDGSINADGVTGIAHKVVYSDLVEGPITAGSINTIENSFEVLGQIILIESFTVFDVTSITPPDLSGLADNDVVEVSGQLDENGSIRATYVTKQSVGNPYEVTGFITGKSGQTFNINSLTVDFSTATPIDFGGREPENGDFVEVIGDLLPGDILSATSVLNRTQVFDDGIELEVEGLIYSFTPSGFTLILPSGGLTVEIDAITIFEGGVFGDLEIGTKVKVKGTISGGILLADKVSFRDNIKIDGVAAGADSVTLTVQLFQLSAITVKVDSRTRLRENRSGFPPASDPITLLDSIRIDDDLKIEGRLESSGSIMATLLEVFDPPADRNEIELQGPVDSDPVDLRFINILGVLVDTDAIPGTIFIDENENLTDRTTFFSKIQAGTLVDVVGTLSMDNRIDVTEIRLED
jgi:predicted acyltransferase (DUF342 family)